jgi:hypothetical protein
LQEPEQVEMVVSPFRHFTDVNTYIAGVRALPGVQRVAMKSLSAGVLTMLVSYDGVVPLDRAMRHVPGFVMSIEQPADGPLRITLRPTR